MSGDVMDRLMSVFRNRPLLLYSYLASELLAPFFASLLILYSVFFLIRLIPLLEVVLSLRIGLADFIRLCAYILPHMLIYVLPMAAMIGVVIGFTRLTNDKEVLAFKACGIGLHTMLPPVIMVALAFSLLTGFFSVKLLPAGEQAMQQLMFQLAREKIEKGLKEKTFTEALGDLVVYVDTIDQDNKWHGVYVSDMRNREMPLITMAREGVMDADSKHMLVTIVLHEGTLHNAQGTDNQVIDFQRYQLQIPLKPPTIIGGDDVTMLSRGAMTQSQLLEMAGQQEPGSKRERIFLTEYYERITNPVGCFILCLLGMPLGMLASPGRKAIGIPFALAFFVLYHFTSTFLEILSEDAGVPLLPAMWLPNILFATMTIYILYRAEQEKTLLPDRIQRCCTRLLDWLLERALNYWAVLARTPLFQRLRLRNKKRAGVHHASMLIHANAHTLTFHLPQCDQYNCPNCTLEFKDADIASRAGFEPCPFCASLLRKQSSTGRTEGQHDAK